MRVGGLEGEGCMCGVFIFSTRGGCVCVSEYRCWRVEKYWGGGG